MNLVLNAVKESLLDLWQIAKGRKLKSDSPVVLAPLIQRLNLPVMPAGWTLMKLGMTKEEFVAGVIEEKSQNGIISRRVVSKITKHYGVKLPGGCLMSAAKDPRFFEKRNRHSMLVVVTA